MTGRSFIVSITTTALIVGIGIGWSVAPSPKPMPAKVQARLVEHRVLTVIDSQRVKRLETENARLAGQVSAQIAVTKQTENFAVKERKRGDTLQAVAIAAQTAADSALAWQAAHDSRKLEADSLRVAGQRHDSTIALQDMQLVKKDSIISTQTARAQRADARIAELEPLATGDDGCRIAKFFKCPTRKQVAIVAVVTGGALGYAVAKKKEINLGLISIRF